MSAIAFDIKETEIHVAVDTLSTDEQGQKPVEVSKALYQPHLGILFAVTGSLWMLDRLPNAILNSGCSRGSEFTIKATEILQELWREHGEAAAKWAAYGQPINISTSIFQFGFSSETGLPACFQYSNTDGFEPRPLKGSGHKPPCPAPEHYGDHRYFIELMKKQRYQEKEKPLANQIHIGGRIILHMLLANAAGAASSLVLHEFDD